MTIFCVKLVRNGAGEKSIDQDIAERIKQGRVRTQTYIHAALASFVISCRHCLTFLDFLCFKKHFIPVSNRVAPGLYPVAARCLD